MKLIIKVVVGRDIHGIVIVMLTHNKLILQSSDINLAGGSNWRKTLQATQNNRKIWLNKRFYSNPMYHNFRVFFWNSPNQELSLLKVGLIKRTQKVGFNKWNILQGWTQYHEVEPKRIRNIRIWCDWKPKEKFMKDIHFRVWQQLGSQLPLREAPNEHYAPFMAPQIDWNP